MIIKYCIKFFLHRISYGFVSETKYKFPSGTLKKHRYFWFLKKNMCNQYNFMHKFFTHGLTESSPNSNCLPWVKYRVLASSEAILNANSKALTFTSLHWFLTTGVSEHTLSRITSSNLNLDLVTSADIRPPKSKGSMG